MKIKIDAIKVKESYYTLLNSGMFWEFFPTLSGTWEHDKKTWIKCYEQGKIKL